MVTKLTYFLAWKLKTDQIVIFLFHMIPKTRPLCGIAFLKTMQMPYFILHIGSADTKCHK